MKNIPGNVETFILVVNKSIKYLLFRFYRTKELMIKSDEVMRTARTEKLELGQKFMIPRPEENSWGKDRVLDKERIIREFVKFTPIMNKKRDEECMAKFLDKVKVNGVQDPGLTPFKEFLPRSAPLVDFLSIGIYSGSGWKYSSSDTIHGIQANQGLFYQMLEDVEVKEIVAGISSPEEILEIRKWMETQQAKDQPRTGVVSMDVEEVRITHYDSLQSPPYSVQSPPYSAGMNKSSPTSIADHILS